MTQTPPTYLRRESREAQMLKAMGIPRAALQTTLKIEQEDMRVFLSDQLQVEKEDRSNVYLNPNISAAGLKASDTSTVVKRKNKAELLLDLYRKELILAGMKVDTYPIYEAIRDLDKEHGLGASTQHLTGEVGTLDYLFIPDFMLALEGYIPTTNAIYAIIDWMNYLHNVKDVRFVLYGNYTWESLDRVYQPAKLSTLRSNTVFWTVGGATRERRS